MAATMDRSGAGGLGGLPPRIGAYVVRGLLGEGGMGRVYLAEQENPRRPVALKVLQPGLLNEEGLRRFEREIRALGRLRHPGIADIYEAGTAATDLGEQPFLAMELVRGRDLVAHAEEAGLDARGRVALFAQVCDAVEVAHRAGIVHRDLKPGNILVDEAGQPKVLDFGLARFLEAEADAGPRTTTTGRLLGTPQFMSPEQALGDQAQVDLRSDVYALGVLLYRLVTGRLPYSLDGKLLPEVLRTICEEEPTPLSESAPRLRGDLETILLKALAKEKDRRYPSAGGLAGDLRRYLGDEPVLARRPSTWYQLRKFAARNRALVIGVAAVIVILAVGLVVVGAALRRTLVAERDAVRARSTSVDLLAQATDLSAQRGFWQRSLEASDGALAGGHADAAGLRVRKAEALIALNRSVDATRELDLLEGTAVPAAGQRAKILLLRGELAMADAADTGPGLALVRKALDSGLAPAEAAYAQGLLAETAPEAVERLRAALELDPFHYRGNKLLAVLLTLLGEYREAEERMSAARLLYPEDPGPRLVLAFVRTLQGDEAGAAGAAAGAEEALGAERVAALLRVFRFTRQLLVELEATASFPGGGAGKPVWEPMRDWLQAFGEAPEAFAKPESTRVAQSAGLAFPVPPVLAGTLPEFQRAFFALQYSMDEPAATSFREVYRRHPIALFAYLEGYLRFGSGRWAEALERFAEAEHARTLTPGIPDQARVGAALCFWNLAREEPARREELQRQAAALARRLERPDELDVQAAWVFAAVADWAGERGIARAVLDSCERRLPDDPNVLRIRARVELGARAYRPACEAADAFLARHGENAQVREYRERALAEARAWLEAPR